jgi:peptidoglycan/LPS O-acetylase OafA/YrhL
LSEAERELISPLAIPDDRDPIICKICFIGVNKEGSLQSMVGQMQAVANWHTEGSRLDALDGMRGLAAFVVVLHHIVLASSPMLAADYAGQPSRPGWVHWWLSETPLHFIWAGPEAVVVFFVLSGFVLALPAVKDGTSWFRTSYFPKRLIRLYLPVWAAILLAAVWRLMEERPRIPTSSWWLQQHAVPIRAHDAVMQGTLTNSGSWAFDPVLWSLHWEVFYSAVLPVALAVIVASRQRPALAGALWFTCGVSVGWGTAAGDPKAEYLPMFVIGALLAFDSHRMTRRLARTASPALGALTIVALLLLTANYWVRPDWFGNGTVSPLLLGVRESATTFGASLMLLLALGSSSFVAVVKSRPIKWLGSRSYSIYLVHEPVVVSLAYALGTKETPLLLLLLAVPAALAIAELFWRAIERPSIKLAKRIAGLVEGSDVSRIGFSRLTG